MGEVRASIYSFGLQMSEFISAIVSPFAFGPLAVVVIVAGRVVNFLPNTDPETKHNAEECGTTCEYRRVPHGSPEKFVCEDLFEVVESDPIISANQRIPVMQTAREGFKNWVEIKIKYL